MIAVTEPARVGNVYLVGFMGVGKTTAAERLAARLGWDVADTDRQIEAEEGRNIEAIFRESGEGYFREAEWRVLQAIAARRRTVVATGGGSFLGVSQRRLMKETGVTVWLDAPLAVAAARVSGGTARPLWMDREPDAFRSFFEKRRAAYALADFRVDASDDRPDAVVDAIHERLRSFWR